MSSPAHTPSRFLRGTRIPTLMFEQSSMASRHVALMIESLIRQNNSAGRPTVLGLATGSTPIGLYRELIRLHRDEGLDFSRVITFNLDEYYPMPPDDPHSYHAWMHAHLFRHLNIPARNIHIPRGDLPPEAVAEHCADLEEKIRRVGGIDFQILGIGRSGHIGFNEPGSTRQSRTRLVTLDPVTRRDAASGFFGLENVPQQAITLGVGTILEAKKIVIMAFGEHKADIAQRSIECEPSDAITASYLQQHGDATFILDEAVASKLAAVQTPWKLGPVAWTAPLVRRAVLWLSFTAAKPLLLLQEDDFRTHELYELIREHGPVSRLTRRVFDEMNGTICTQPGGSTPCRALVFSPHPDDDVISMGGTLIHLVDQGHEVHVAYMTSGNIAVFDHDALRFADFVAEFNRHFKIDLELTQSKINQVRQSLAAKSPGHADVAEVLYIKGLIRATEARAAALSVGIQPERLHFMDMPFYRTGTIEKAPITDADVAITADLIRQLAPAQIYVAGDLSDPHGTHRVCADAIFRALRILAHEGFTTETWLYRGAWEEWEPHEVERVVPLSPDDMERKKMAIFKHQSQKDRAMFPGGADEREFWQRAEQRNRHTAELFDRLGLPQFYALEGLVQWRGLERTGA
ncbi:MAG TPA: glucosamine-6-phosphate deaminase [Gemmatales bacterium]|nr:glucosamine-6-phosphate deaminase [Gemmatales bacterium]HMP57913.1 glucosamine-6-phosphate deaminase [Gemmatales bacterium]